MLSDLICGDGDSEVEWKDTVYLAASDSPAVEAEADSRLAEILKPDSAQPAIPRGGNIASFPLTEDVFESERALLLRELPWLASWR